MTFDQETHDRLRFERNPLKVVVAQVRFPTSYLLGDPGVQGRIQAEFLERFPEALPPVQEIMVALTQRGPEQIQTKQGPARFADPTKRTIVSIGPAMASLETTFYEGWERFREQIADVLDVVARHGSPTGMTRFGLRYVDEIAIDEMVSISDWSRALSDSVLGDANSLARDPRTIRTQQRVTIPIGEDVVNAIHGYVRNLEPGGQPASTYVIDADIFTEAAGPWDIESTLDRADRYHRWMINVFVRSLTHDGIELMGGTER